jgi:hypothetical protein
VSSLDPFQSPAERIYLGIVKNHGCHPNRHQDSIDALIWAEGIHVASPAALDTVLRVLPLPSESLLNSQFAPDRRFVPGTLQDDNRIEEVI